MQLVYFFIGDFSLVAVYLSPGLYRLLFPVMTGHTSLDIGYCTFKQSYFHNSFVSQSFGMRGYLTFLFLLKGLEFKLKCLVVEVLAAPLRDYVE